MNGLYFGANVDGGTFPADMWGDYMGRVKGSFCSDFEPPGTPFISSPFFGKYSKSGGSLTGGVVDAEPDPGTEPDAPDESSPDREEKPKPGAGEEGFDPTQYESEPQAPPEAEAPADPGEGGGAVAPPG